METVLKGRKGVVRIGPDHPTVLIGKPMHRRLANKSAAGHIEIAKNEALAQVAAGADLVNVRVEAAGPEQVTLLPLAIKTVQEVIEVPLCIDTPDPEALAAAMAVCQGKPLVNSVHGDESSLSRVLPLVAEHKAAVIGRCKDEEGLPNEPRRRLEIARRIVERAQALGIPREDILIDCLTAPIEQDPRAALVALEAIRAIRAELGVNMTLDASSISSDLPNRQVLSMAFLAMAITAGVHAPIANASQARQTIVAQDVLLGRDDAAMRYCRYYQFHRSGMRGLVDWELV